MSKKHEKLVAEIQDELNYATEAGGWDCWDDATVKFLLDTIREQKQQIDSLRVLLEVHT